MNVNALLQTLEARLPELEWKISTLGRSFSKKSLPRGLFSDRMEQSAASFITEIKADMTILMTEKSSRSAYYLAQRIHQKINVLVKLCQLHIDKPKREEKISFGIDQISTRQQWLQRLEEDVNRLTVQHEAMINAINKSRSFENPQALLNLKAELGEVEKRLTLARETLAAQSL